MNFLKDIYYSLIFLADEKYNKSPFLMEKVMAMIKLLSTFGPIAYLLNVVDLWFISNKEFISGFLVIVMLNAWYGIKKHRKLKTFDWKVFFKKTRDRKSVV